MLNKTICTLLLFCLINNGVSAQKFMQSAGATINAMYSNSDANNGNSSVTLVLKNVTYFPRVNLLQGGKSSLSAGVPLSVGFGTYSNLSDGSSDLYFGFDVPMAIDYNIGYGSGNDEAGNFGGYIGGGFGYTYTNFNLSDYYGDSYTYKAISYGPMVRGGVRFGFSLSSGSETPEFGITLGLFYKTGLEAAKFKTGGLNILFDF